MKTRSTRTIGYDQLNVGMTPEIEIQRSRLYQILQSEINEVNKHKWIESEKAHRNVGWEWALMDWIIYHRANWVRKQLSTDSGSTISRFRR